MQLQPLGIHHCYASHSGNEYNYMLLNFVHSFLCQLQICSTVMFSFLFKMLLMLSSNTSLCLRLEITASEHHPEVQAGVLTEESWNAFFSMEFFMHRQVKGETWNYFRTFQHVKIILLCPPACLFMLRAVRLESTSINAFH